MDLFSFLLSVISEFSLFFLIKQVFQNEKKKDIVLKNKKVFLLESETVRAARLLKSI